MTQLDERPPHTRFARGAYIRSPNNQPRPQHPAPRLRHLRPGFVCSSSKSTPPRLTHPSRAVSPHAALPLPTPIPGWLVQLATAKIRRPSRPACVRRSPPVPSPV
ncbi:hypothetical protein HYPSUDRAFT_210213 [Hypholoma sublateritium FD-334 SS-4]|uniref:Uncharacterized protein n=1 Tax=Hypholoma sublateritium (strain FD-334 SS-4) TaxID=945553 RepID=A0A0D2N7H5_HYPSF|nr:hypothetical protein HYPSUDRAFT_210213 [Hypholoma sublateritium FD-334 SS-4]